MHNNSAARVLHSVGCRAKLTADRMTERINPYKVRLWEDDSPPAAVLQWKHVIPFSLCPGRCNLVCFVSLRVAAAWKEQSSQQGAPPLIAQRAAALTARLVTQTRVL
ncbi:hypothetical protein VTK26DRAFT_5158 [Humicola hyalothermophila]